MSKKTASTLLGLALDGGRLEGVVLRRTNGSLKVQKSFAGDLSLKILADDPELVGREIRNILDQAGVRERRCLFCLPVSWLSTNEVKLPELPEEDLESFLELEAERGFHFGYEMLSQVTSRFQTSFGEKYATQLAVPLSHLSRLELVLRAARLRAVSFTPGITAMERAGQANESEGLLGLHAGEDKVDLLLTAGGGVVALRSLDCPSARGEAEEDSLMREIRITLGQVPSGLQQRFRLARIYPSGKPHRALVGDLALELADMGFQCEERAQTLPDDLEGKLPAGTPASPVTVAVARHLMAMTTGFEFLPPRISSWQRFGQRVSSRKLAWTGVAAAAAAVLFGSAFFVQQWQLNRLENQWAAIRPQVEELDGLQQRIRKYRAWFDVSLNNLNLLRELTQAFPADGRVTAKTVEIRNTSNVACTGTATDNQALLDTLDQLRAKPGVAGVKVDQIRGKSPLQFVFNYQWNLSAEGGYER